MMIKYAIAALLIFTVAACSKPTVEQPPRVETVTIETKRPAPIVPEVDRVNMREVRWHIITPENVDEKFAQIRRGELVFFALTAEGYENIALNLSDIRALVQQQQRIIAIYESQF